MSLFRSAGILLVTMAFFSAGAVMGSRTKSKPPNSAPSPSFVDMGVIVLCWLAVLIASISGFKTVVTNAIGAGVGLFAGFILHCLWKQPRGDELNGGNSSGKILGLSLGSSTSCHAEVVHRFWANWRSFAREVGGFQSRLILGAIYIIAVMPLSILVRNLGDPLKINVPPRESFWRSREVGDENLDAARRQS